MVSPLPALVPWTLLPPQLLQLLMLPQNAKHNGCTTGSKRNVAIGTDVTTNERLASDFVLTPLDTDRSVGVATIVCRRHAGREEDDAESRPPKKESDYDVSVEDKKIGIHVSCQQSTNS